VNHDLPAHEREYLSSRRKKQGKGPNEHERHNTTMQAHFEGNFEGKVSWTDLQGATLGVDRKLEVLALERFQRGG
jgi:hypothetical protein